MAKLLTDLAIRALKTPAARREIADAKMDGLALVLEPSGTRRWTYRYRYGKRPRRISLGTWPVVNLAKARARAESAVHALERGDDPGVTLFGPKRAQHLATVDRDAFGVVLRRFMQDHAIPNTRGWREAARLMGLAVVEDGKGPPTFEDIPGRLAARWAEKLIGSITGRDIIDVIDATRARGAPIVANRELSAMRKLFSWAVGKRIIDANPAAGIPAPSKETQRDRVLSDDELRLIWTAADGEGFPFGDIVKLLVLTAQRRIEVAAAPWAEFDLKAATWLLPGARTKNGRPHLVPLSDAALGVLADLPRIVDAAPGDERGRSNVAERVFLFGHRGGGGYSGFSRAKARFDERVAEMADSAIAPWTLHDLRRTAATRMAKLGVQPIVIESALNHISGTKGGIAGVYNVHAYEAEKRAALDAWARYVERVVDPDAVAA